MMAQNVLISDWEAARLFLAKGPSATLQFLKEEPRVLLFAYQAQAIDGPCPQDLNIALTADHSLRKKQEAWKALGNMPPVQAQAKLVELLTAVLPEWKDWRHTHLPSVKKEQDEGGEAERLLKKFYAKLALAPPPPHYSRL